MKINRIVSDSGRSECRFVFGDNTYSFPAAVGSGKEFRMPDLEGGIDSLAIKYDGREYLIGELALNEDRFNRQVRVRDKTSDPHTRVQLAAGTAFILAEHNMNDWEGRAVVNYNIRDFSKNKVKFQQDLLRAYEVRITRGKHTGKTIRFKFTDVRVLPEGVGAMYSAVYDPNTLEIVRPDLAKDNVAVIDIGSQTCNIAYFKGLRFIEEFSGAWDLGMHVAEIEMLNFLNDAYDYEPNIAELKDIFEKKSIRIGDMTHLIAPEASEILRKHAGKIIDQISALIPEADRKQVNHVLVSGGGSVLVPYLKPAFYTNDIQGLHQSRWANCFGQEIMAKMKDA